jgi:hypothetical protein
MKKARITFLLVYFMSACLVFSQVTERERPAEWKNLVFGGRFMDRFLPMPDIGRLTGDTWGDKNVVPRFTGNGIENRKYSFWGGNKVFGDDGKYHFYVCGWLESSPKGHAAWPQSTVFHAVSENLYGPFVVRDTIGKGHNPEVFRLSDGRYVIYVIDGYYIADGVNGPWKYGKFEFLNRDRKLIEGNSNFTFAKREDGSYLMICRGGGQWISQSGLTSYGQVTGTKIGSDNKIVPLRAYPPVEGRFEDPVVWRDNVQYNLIVNDWLGRIAFYERSKDGVNWKVESGEAYVPGVSVHQDGTVEAWWKYERMKIFQDKHGRALQANFAVIDVEKKFDLANDNHSSKNISIPLTPGRILTILDKKPITSATKTIKVRISAEEGFNPNTDININSLQFGDPEKVNFGKGGKVIRTEKSGADLIVTFDAVNNGIPEDEFAAKMIGKTTNGKLLYGYARLPGVDFTPPILSCCLPVISSSENGFNLKVEVQNFGQSASKTANISISYLKDNKEVGVATGKVMPLNPYEKANIELKCGKLFEKGVEYVFVVTISPGTENQVKLHGRITPLK